MERAHEGLGHYRITVRETLGPEWTAWFDGFVVHPGEHGTTLCGPVIDQSALYGLISKVRDLGLTLVSVVREAPEGIEQAPPSSGT